MKYAPPTPTRRLRRVFQTSFSSLLLAGITLGPLVPVQASDHIDSPTVTQDRGSDIADLWAFLDPNDNSQVILVLSTQGFVVSGEHFGMVIFDHNIRYRFEIENTGDAIPDLALDVLYSPGLGRLTTQTATVTLSMNLRAARVDRIASFTAPTTASNQEPQPTPPPAPVVTVDSASGMKFFGGNADDAFFLDDTGANRFVASSFTNPGMPNKALFGERQGRDTYAGFNTMMTVVSVPAALLRGNSNVIGINSLTQRRRIQVISKGAARGAGAYVNVDRQGNPLVVNGLISPSLKNLYNGSTTREDARGLFVADLTKNLAALGTNPTFIDMILTAIQKTGDILRLDLTVPNTGPQGGTNPTGGFGNMGGRRLVDDVVDATFMLINNGAPLSDFVNANEVPFRDFFPFVADPTQPFPPGQDPDDHTRQ